MRKHLYLLSLGLAAVLCLSTGAQPHAATEPLPATDVPWNWNTFMGSDYYDGYDHIALDGDGNIYVSGSTWRSWGTPLNPHAGDLEVFVAKLSSSGTREWHTFLGSTDAEFSGPIAADREGNVYVVGSGPATWGDPINPHAGSTGGGRDVFVAKLNSSGTLQWHTFLGSPSDDWGSFVDLDGNGNIYVTGYSWATWGAPHNPHAGSWDTFVAKLNGSGTRQWNTFLGSGLNDMGKAVTVDGAGNIYVAGTSFAAWGAPLNPFAGGSDAFVAKLNSSSVRQWHTFLGSASDDTGNGVGVDGSGNVYVVGQSNATWGMPVNPYAGSWDAFAAKLDSSGARQWHTFLGSAGDDEIPNQNSQSAGLVLYGNAGVYLAGFSAATWGTPVNPHAGSWDAFAAKLNSSGARQWHTFVGSSDVDHGGAITVGGCGTVYMCGTSNATWGTPVDPFVELYDVFVVDLGAGSGQTYSIGGRIADSAGIPISAVTVSADCGYVTTSAGDGYFTLNSLPAWTYTLTPSKSRCTFSPSSRTVTVGPDKTGMDFVGTCTYSGYMPAVMKAPPLTYLYVTNQTTGLVLHYTVHGTPEGDINCANIPAGVTEFCGSFTPGTYHVSVDTSQCGTSAGQVSFATGDVTRVVRCR